MLKILFGNVVAINFILVLFNFNLIVLNIFNIILYIYIYIYITLLKHVESIEKEELEIMWRAREKGHSLTRAIFVGL